MLRFPSQKNKIAVKLCGSTHRSFGEDAVNQCCTGRLTCKVNGLSPEGITQKPPVNRNAAALPQMQIYKGT